VLTDLVMPEISGWEVVETIRGRAPSMPIVLITALSDAVMRRANALRVPVIAKPFRLEILRAVLVEALQKKIPPSTTVSRIIAGPPTRVHTSDKADIGARHGRAAGTSWRSRWAHGAQAAPGAPRGLKSLGRRAGRRKATFMARRGGAAGDPVRLGYQVNTGAACPWSPWCRRRSRTLRPTGRRPSPGTRPSGRASPEPRGSSSW
jgi:hypothetical protein